MDAFSVRRIVLTGINDISASIDVPDHCEIQGDNRNGATVRVPAGATFPAFNIDGKTGVQIRNLQGAKIAGAALSSRGYLAWIHGASADTLIEDVLADGFVSAVQVGYGPTGVADGIAERITLRRVTALNSPSLFGFCLDDVDVALIDDCHARGNWLDGIKLRKLTNNVTIRGGSFNQNGASGLGDGMDAYAGGNAFTIDGTIFKANASNGFTIKSGDLNQSTQADYGRMQNVIVRDVRAIDNAGIGGYLTVTDPTDMTEPLVNGVAITGGVYDRNGANGLYLNAANVTVNAPIVRRNGEHGIVTSGRAFQVDINDALVIANGQSAANSYDGININGSYIRVNGGQIVGIDADDLAIESDQANLTKLHRYGIEIASAANQVEVNWPACRYMNSHGIHDSGATGVAIVNQRRGGNPTATGTYGAVGSHYVRDYSSNSEDGHETHWVKTAGGRNTPTTGWTRLIVGAPVTSLPQASEALRGLVLQLHGGAGVADTWNICAKKADDSYAWFAVGLN